MKIKAKYPIFLALLLGSSTIIGYSIEELKNSNKTVNFSISDDNTKTADNKLITDIYTAEELSYLDKNPSYEDLINAVNNNSNIDNSYNIKDYLYKYIKDICSKKPNFDKAILKRNIELLKLNYYSAEQIKNITNNEFINAFFDPNEHSININNELKIEDYIYHEFSHMTRVLIEEKENGVVINIGFSIDKYGKAFEEEINQDFTNSIEYDYSTYKVENIYLLKEIINEEDLNDIYNNHNIYSLEEKLFEINDNIDPNYFINTSDTQNILLFDENINNDYDVDYELYKMYIDYFLSLKEIDYSNFVENYDKFYDILSSINTDNIIRDKLIFYLEDTYQKSLTKKM